MCQICACTQNFDPRRHEQNAGHHLDDPMAAGATGATAADLVYGSSWGDTPSSLGDAGGVVTYSIADAGLSLAAFGQGNIQSVDGNTFYSEIDYEAEIAAAFQLWSDVANIEFVEIEDGGGNPGTNQEGDIRIFFGAIPGNTIGLAYLPSFFGGSALAGDIMLDDVNTSSSWGLNTFRALLVHEIGHAIGLQHVPNGSNSVMTPTVGISAPTAFDAAGLQQVYGAQDNAPAVLDLESFQTDLNLVRGLQDLTVNGNSQNNFIDGTESAETINGASGNDRLLGRGGNDQIDGGNNADTVEGGAGNDTITAGSGNDSVLGNEGRDWASLGSGNDFFRDDVEWASNGNDTVLAGSGNDTIAGWGGDDEFDGESGDDLIYGGSGNDTIDGGSGNDALLSGSGNDSVSGDEGNDWVALEDGNDFFRDAFEWDGAGQDTVFGGAGNDTIAGWGGNDRFDGEAGDDLIYGGFGRDVVTGGTGRDWIDLGTGNDTYFDTEETGENGRDTITGGSGADRFVFGDVISKDTIRDFEVGTDTLELSSALVSGRSAQDVVDDFANVVSNGVLLTFGADESIFLQGLASTAGLASSITISDDPIA